MSFIKELEKEAAPIPDNYSYCYVDHNGHEIYCYSWKNGRRYFYRTWIDGARLITTRISKLDYLFYYVSARNDNILTEVANAR